ncbi:sulfotransferase family 5A, member 1 [Callorhinchus milii]|uniref:Sulfotransferase n=1 Tax=Callorhinchus milii TaxID=7868 RepID=V9L770_CALMI|nr:sulfotransferase family 5A, member 1 [Callorhinchus milii]|eukprot:gi/632944480/ref/XP_007887532.1/ PREDICTED: sulfotransferase family cytosolic 2B member 1-like [Callorhinchus milii]
MADLDVTLNYSGINFPGHLHTMKSLQYAKEFKFHKTDTLLVTYPKSGTTWMQEILTLIYSAGNEVPVKTLPNWMRAPWLEQYYSEDILQNRPDNRIITSHLPYHILSKTLKQSNPKVIYISRNPKDIIVSFYYFHKMAQFLPDPGTFEEFVRKFAFGEVHFGSWFDHITEWLEHKEEFNILFITYEEMKKNLRQCVEKTCDFLGRPLLPEQIDSIIRYCTFTNMKDNQMVNYTLVPNEIMDHRISKFMRKGIVGDWKEHFTEEQSQFFKKICQEKLCNSDIRFIWNL